MVRVIEREGKKWLDPTPLLREKRDSLKDLDEDCEKKQRDKNDAKLSGLSLNQAFPDSPNPD